MYRILQIINNVYMYTGHENKMQSGIKYIFRDKSISNIQFINITIHIKEKDAIITCDAPTFKRNNIKEICIAFKPHGFSIYKGILNIHINIFI